MHRVRILAQQAKARFTSLQPKASPLQELRTGAVPHMGSEPCFISVAKASCFLGANGAWKESAHPPASP